MTDLRRIALFAALLLACRSSRSAPVTPDAGAPPTKPAVKPAPSASHAAAPAAPPLASGVTGFTSRDRSLDLERCKKTSWSYTGCAATYPLQGRIFVDWECANVADDRDHNIVCARAAEFRIRGVGGPIARSEGLSTLRTLCSTPLASGKVDHVTCFDLASELLWSDAAGARALMGPACDDAPAGSPVGCSELRAALAGGLRSFDVKVGSVSGLPGVAVGDTCALGVWEGGDCHARVSCGERILYDGSFPCTFEPTGVVGHEDMTSPTDADAAFALDTRAGTLVMHDDASTASPAWSLKGTPRPRAR